MSRRLIRSLSPAYGMTIMTSAPPHHVQFTVADFNRMGSHSGFSYRLPRRPAQCPQADSFCIAEGRVREHVVRDGMTMVLSDLQVHEDYESTSRQTPHFSIIVLLQGQAEAQLDRTEGVRLQAQGGVCAIQSEPMSLSGWHPGGQHLRSLNLSLQTSRSAGDERLCELVDQMVRKINPGLQPWQVPPHLLQMIQHLHDCDWDEPLQSMLRDSVSDQLLLHATAALSRNKPCDNCPVSQRDRQLLQRVCDQLHESPGEDYSLAELARLACMSSSTLRAKFQSVYQCSVFHWLRTRRLELAREHLCQGLSVQEVAQLVGYRHASNFTTAFRAHYGVAPREIH